MKFIYFEFFFVKSPYTVSKSLLNKKKNERTINKKKSQFFKNLLMNNDTQMSILILQPIYFIMIDHNKVVTKISITSKLLLPLSTFYFFKT